MTAFNLQSIFFFESDRELSLMQMRFRFIPEVILSIFCLLLGELHLIYVYNIKNVSKYKSNLIGLEHFESNYSFIDAVV